MPDIFIQSPLLTKLNDNHFRHGFFKRTGGVSNGIYSSLNAGLGSGDERTSVTQNRKRICNAVGVKPSHLATVHQHHSTDVIQVTDIMGDDRPKADGLVTNKPGIALGVVTADCGPVLFADPENKVIGAAHAGWRGAFDGVLENTIAKMVELGASRKHIRASLGPSISQKNYEVGPEFIARFKEREPSTTKYFIPSQKPEHFMFDLKSFTSDILDKQGVQQEILDVCTYEQDENYFSYRRTTHKNERDYGRQLSVIVMGA